MCRLHCRLFLLLTGCSLGAIVLPAQGSDMDTLLSKPPFGAQAVGTDSATAVSQPLAFRGVTKENDRWYFSIHEVNPAHSDWVELNERGNRDFTVTHYDPSQQRVTVDYQGGVMTLSLSGAPPAPALPNKPVPEAVRPPQDYGRLPTDVPGAQILTGPLLSPRDSGRFPTVAHEGTVPAAAKPPQDSSHFRTPQSGQPPPNSAPQYARPQLAPSPPEAPHAADGSAGRDRQPGKFPPPPGATDPIDPR